MTSVRIKHSVHTAQTTCSKLIIFLDGGWDADDPWIGSIVNAHTNLTEIKMAMDLLWRNDIEPSQVTMGLGFYGRSV
jgi:hypothetical protein